MKTFLARQTIINRYSDELLLALGSIIISFSAVFVKITQTPPTVTGVYRMLFGGIILMIWAIAKRQAIKPTLSLSVLMFFAGAFIGLDIAFWHHSIHHVGPGLATVLGNCQVFLLIVIGLLFYHERVKARFFFSIPIAAIGLFCLVGHKWQSLTPDYRLGVMQGLATAIFYSFYTTTLKKTRIHQNKLATIANLAWVSLFGSLILAIIAYAEHQSFQIADHNNFYYLLLYAFCSQALGWQLISIGLPNVNLSTAGFLILLQPSLSFVWDILFFARPTPLIEILGASLTLISIYISVTSQAGKGS